MGAHVQIKRGNVCSLTAVVVDDRGQSHYAWRQCGIGKRRYRNNAARYAL